VLPIAAPVNRRDESCKSSEKKLGQQFPALDGQSG
jgi:hypothetical protein